LSTYPAVRCYFCVREGEWTPAPERMNACEPLSLSHARCRRADVGGESRESGGEKRERRSVSWADDGEVAAVDGGDLGDAEAFGCGDDGGVGAAEG
jgi:hypothetical protein